MASQVLSGAGNATYTNNTGQNVRLIINYMANVTSMTWAGVNVTASATTIGKDIQNITGEIRCLEKGNQTRNDGILPGANRVNIWELRVGTRKPFFYEFYNDRIAENTSGPTYDPNFVTGESTALNPLSIRVSALSGTAGQNWRTGANFFYVPTTVSRGGNFPVEIMLAPNQGYSAVCGAFNIVAIKEDGT